MVLKIYQSKSVGHAKSLLRRKFIDLINLYLSENKKDLKLMS